MRSSNLDSGLDQSPETRQCLAISAASDFDLASRGEWCAKIQIQVVLWANRILAM